MDRGGRGRSRSGLGRLGNDLSRASGVAALAGGDNGGGHRHQGLGELSAESVGGDDGDEVEGEQGHPGRRRRRWRGRGEGRGEGEGGVRRGA